jgi:hypothetical protein
MKKITKEDLILIELKHLNETQKEIKEDHKRFEDSINKKFDNLKTNDFAHIEDKLKDMVNVFDAKFDNQTNVFNAKLDNQTKEFNAKFDNQDKELHDLDKGLSKIDKEVHGLRSQMNMIIPIIVGLFILILGLYFK